MMNKINAVYVSILALIVSLAALVMCVVCCNKKVETVNVEEAIYANPEMIVKAMQNYEQQARERALAQAQKVIDENIEEINNNQNTPVMGNPNGSIVLVEFFDFSCGYCHRLYPALKNIIAKNPEVKLVLKELTFVSKVSDYAARAGIAANMQGKYAEYYNGLMSANGSLTEEKINEIAAANGIDVVKMKEAANSEKVRAIVKETAELASKIEIGGVPTMILNGKMLQTLDESVIQERIDALK